MTLLRTLLVAVAVAAGLIAAAAQTEKVATAPTRIEIDARLLPAFRMSDPQRVQFGHLRFRGGLELASRHRDFGGLSGLRVGPDGEKFLAVTDRGMWLSGRITYAGTAPSGIADAEMTPLIGADGSPITARRHGHDTEALTLDGGIAHVALERMNEILRFDLGRDGLAARGRPIKVPYAFVALPWNRGIEALAVPPAGAPLAGTLIAVAEGVSEATGAIPGFLIGGESPGRFAVTASDGFDVTDAAILPPADLLLLERHFSVARGVAMRLRRIPLAAIAPGATVAGEVLMTADYSHQIDNMEGLSVHRDAAGAIVLTIVSDDNFAALQRTLLLQFTLAE